MYVWESEQALQDFRESDLGRSIGDEYRVDGGPRSELADIRLVVRNPTAFGQQPRGETT